MIKKRMGTVFNEKLCGGFRRMCKATDMIRIGVAATLVMVCIAAAQAKSRQTFTWNKNAWVAFDESVTATVECPDPAATEWVKAHFAEWYGAHSPKVTSGKTSLEVQKDDEAYAAEVDATGVKIASRMIAGARWACYTLRQIAIAKRGTFTTEGMLLPTLKISDAPHLPFRCMHFCWFPEVRPQQIERAIRLAALMKFNYAIIEPWGMYKSEKHPWWPWPQANMTKAEVNRLVAIGKDIGITLIPQINTYGHATSARGCTLKHSALDLNPEYEPLFEPGGWNWCLSNPETQRVLRELIAEMHENFGNPPFFHLGCDEAEPQTCPECVKTPNAELVCKHITGLAEFVKSRGARAMIWHDMLLDRKDPRWAGFTVCGNAETGKIIDKLPKDIIICDWQYQDTPQHKKDALDKWPTMTYFAEKGFSVAGCPWLNDYSMKPIADHIVRIGGFGFIETTWHHLRGSDWQKIYRGSAYAAWGSPVSHDVSFQRSLRLVGNDMKLTDYLDTGHLNHQVPPAWWAN
ncbi:MAG: family 20 glycosylhydrolase [Kiritimatiellae bacterium]|nr:family 20 glycosylhydrolase [Kiritimatiellia bacterium]